MALLPITALTESQILGNGVFDKLMQAMNVQMDSQFKLQRIKGPEYATVYLGALDVVLRTAVDFLLQQQKIDLEVEILQEQVLLAKEQVLKIRAEVLQTNAQTDLIKQQELNAVAENAVLVAQECKLRAEFDVLVLQKAKTQKETDLLAQKVLTEKAQVTEMGVDANSVIGRQKGLYFAQTRGFESDTKQKVAKILIDTWNVRRTTDDGTVADDVNKLADQYIGRAVNGLLTDANV